MSEKKANTETEKKLSSAKISLAEMMDSLRPFLPARETHEPEPSKDWRMAEECNGHTETKRDLQEADV